MIDSHEPKCPYCGYINPSGAQEQFMEKMEENRLKLDNVDEEAAELYQKEMKKKGKRLVITIVVTAVVIAGILLAAKLNNKLLWDSYERTPEDEVAEIAWQRAHFPELTELYDAEKYEEMVDLYYDFLKDGSHDIWLWEHYNFLDAMTRYRNLRSNMEYFDRYVKDSDSSCLASVLYNCARFFYRDYENEPKNTEHDLEVLDEVHDYAVEILHNRLHFSDEDMEEIRDEIYGDGYVNFNACEKVIKRNMNKIKE